MTERGWKPWLMDTLTGVATFVLAVIAIVTLRQSRVLGLCFIGALCVAVAVLRSGRKPGAAWLHGLLLGFVAGVPLVLIGMFAPGSKSASAEWALFVLALVLCSTAAWTAALWKSGARRTSLIACVGSIAAIWMTWTVVGIVRGPKATVSSVDSPLPELALQRMDGTPIASSELQGHVTVLDFWGTWCPSCVEEMPVLNKVAADYGGDSRVRFLLVNPEINGDDPAKIQAFVKKRNVTIPVALDPSETCFKLGPVLFPMMAVIDRRGHMRYLRSGYAGAWGTRKELRREVDELLKEQSG